MGDEEIGRSDLQSRGRMERWPIDRPILDPRNARKHGAKNRGAIRDSLLEHGQLRPILVREATGVVIAGNGTLDEMRKLGTFEEVDVFIVDMTAKEAEAYGIRDNRTGELAEWETGQLSALLRALAADDVDLKTLGFDETDQQKLFEEDLPPGPGDDPDIRRKKVASLGAGRKWVVIRGDVEKVMETIEDQSCDAVLSDPPYGISFMGKAWDHGVPSAEIWAEILRALRPGGHALIFGAARMYHRLAVAIEDAGFEMRDCIAWLYGTGFPKSADISKKIDAEVGAKRDITGEHNPAKKIKGFRGKDFTYVDHFRRGKPASRAAAAFYGWGTTLKPAWEPCALAMRPLAETFAKNALEHGVSGMNILGARVGDEERVNQPMGSPERSYGGFGGKGGAAAREFAGTQGGERVRGRWPANLVLDEEAAALLSEQHGPAERFFYCAKASNAERDAGLDLELFSKIPQRATMGGFPNDPGKRGSKNVLNPHPTVKPIALTRWLATLLLPPDTGTPRRILVPFSGVGSEMIGCLLAGWDEVIGIELSEEYSRVAEARLTWWENHLTQAPEIEAPENPEESSDAETAE